MRGLFLNKEDLRKKMASLWALREGGQDWTPEQQKQYAEYSAKADKVNKDLKLMAEYTEQFKQQKQNNKEDADFEKSKRDCSLFKIIKSRIFEQTKDPAYREDFGRTNEVLSEHRQMVGDKHVQDGYLPIPESCLNSPDPRTRKMTEIQSTGATGGGSLISEIARSDLYVPGLYESLWMAQAGVVMLNNLVGDVKIPQISNKPSFSWIGEGADFPEQDMTLKNQTLTPKYAGGWQGFTLATFLRTGEEILRFVQMEMTRAFASGLQKSFLQDDANPVAEPEGLIAKVPADNQITADANQGTNRGGDLTLAKVKEVEQKIVETNQNDPLVWLISHKVRIRAEQILKFAVSGSSELFKDGMLAGTKTVITNGIPDNIKRGTGDTSTAVLFQPKSIVLGRWTGGLSLQINTQGAEFWKKGSVGVRILDACNMVSRRDSDLASLKEIHTTG